MGKITFFGLVVLVMHCDLHAQYIPEHNIDSLKKILPYLRDTSKVDCFNELSYAYTLISKQDSAAYYSLTALKEAKRLRYVHGIAEALSRQAGLVEHFENNFFKEEKTAKEALKWFNKTPNKKNIGILYDQLAFSLFSQSSYDDALGYLQNAYDYYKNANDEYNMGQAVGFFSSIYVEKGDYVKGLNYAQQELQMAVKFKNETWIKGALMHLGTLCLRIEDYTSALYYYRQVLQKITHQDSIYQGVGEYNTWAQMEFAEIYTHLHQYDSALYRYNLFDSANADEKDLRVFLISKGEYYFATKNYNAALHNFLTGLYYHQKLNDVNEIKRALLDIGETYAAINRNKEALKNAREGLDIALKTNAKQFIRDGYEILYSVYDNLHQTDSAFYYYRQYITMKDIVSSEVVKGKFASYNYEQKITILNQEKQIQQAKLIKEQFRKKILYAGVLGLLLFGFIFFRNIYLKRRNEANLRQIAENELQMEKMESEKKQKEYEYKTTELEMKALRAQMNPHFIFNCLSSINRFILKNESEAASDYLTKFSRLIRMVLVNSKQAFIILEDELEMLKLYLELERLRFKYSFDYRMQFENEIDSQSIFIPPLLLQPFVENAIWHGLLNKEGQGQLLIALSIENNVLKCVISDNGVGRKKAAELKSKSANIEKSMGLKITSERLALLNADEVNDTSYFVEDIYDNAGNAAGTQVTLKMRLTARRDEYAVI